MSNAYLKEFRSKMLMPYRVFVIERLHYFRDKSQFQNIRTWDLYLKKIEEGYKLYSECRIISFMLFLYRKWLQFNEKAGRIYNCEIKMSDEVQKSAKKFLRRTKFLYSGNSSMSLSISNNVLKSVRSKFEYRSEPQVLNSRQEISLNNENKVQCVQLSQIKTVKKVNNLCPNLYPKKSEFDQKSGNIPNHYDDESEYYESEENDDHGDDDDDDDDFDDNFDNESVLSQRQILPKNSKRTDSREKNYNLEALFGNVGLNATPIRESPHHFPDNENNFNEISDEDSIFDGHYERKSLRVPSHCWPSQVDVEDQLDDRNETFQNLEQNTEEFETDKVVLSESWHSFKIPKIPKKHLLKHLSSFGASSLSMPKCKNDQTLKRKRHRVLSSSSDVLTPRKQIKTEASSTVLSNNFKYKFLETEKTAAWLIQPWIPGSTETALMTQEILNFFYKCMDGLCLSKGVGYIDMLEFMIHLKNHEESGINKMEKKFYQCSYCNFHALNRNDLLNHLEKHKSCAYQCQYCFFRTYSNFQMFVHQIRCHKGRNYKCLELQNKDSEGCNLQKFILRKDSQILYGCEFEPLKCPYPECSYHDFVPRSFENHLKCHTTVIRICTVCNAICSSIDSIVRHMIVCEKFLDCACAYCDFGSTKRIQMKEHYKEHHLDEIPVFYKRRKNPAMLLMNLDLDLNEKKRLEFLWEV